MKGKRILARALSLALLGGVNAAAAAEKADAAWRRTEPGGRYVTVRLSYPEWGNLSWAEAERLCVRYADTKTPVALSSGFKWGGWLFATVPAADAERPLEVFQGEKARFPDCISVWQGNEYDNAPQGTQQLVTRGVIRGDGSGNLRPKGELTRAEAFTIIKRLLSLAPGGAPGYADVSQDAWYYDAVSAARVAGIAAEDVNFNPGRVLTRAEFTVMLCRAVQYAGWLDAEESAGTLDFADGKSIPDWAEEKLEELRGQEQPAFSTDMTMK